MLSRMGRDPQTATISAACGKRRTAPLALLSVLTLLSGAAVGAAPPPEALEQLKQANETAAAAFASYSYSKGITGLHRALATAAAHGIKNHPHLASSYVLLGVGAVAGKNDSYRGVHYLVRGLRIDSKAQIPSSLVTPQLKQIFDGAKRTLRAVHKPRPIKLGAEQRREAQRQGVVTGVAGARGLKHDPIDGARRGYPIPIKASPGIDVRVTRMFLHYRGPGKVKFSPAEMRRQGNTFRGSIPAQFTRGAYVHYYVEARDPRGRQVAKSGSAASPNVVTLK